VSRHAGLRLRVYVIGGFIGLVGSLALGQPEPAILAVAMLVVVVVGLVWVGRPTLEVVILDAPTSIVEGEEREVVIRLRSDLPADGIYLDLRPAPGLRIEQVEGASLVQPDRVWCEIDGQLDITVTFAAVGWGRRSIGPIMAYGDSALGLLELRQEFSQVVTMVSVPSDTLIAGLLIPRETNLHSGDLVSKLRGVGSEFAELRPYRPGDDPRALNWRVSSRTASWWVNDRHPERNGDVVMVVDGQTQPGTGGDLLVDRAVRLAGGLVRDYGRRRYRLGLVTVDGVARWIQPGSGELHRRRLVEQLLDIHGGESSRATIERAVLRVAVRPALVIILTPMLDDSLAGLAHSLRVSGLDVAMIEIDPIGFLSPPKNEPREIGRRVWRMERERLRNLLVGDGIPVAPWKAGEPADVALAQIASWRSAWRLPV
jgi:uncharacterized protein (DUF58 family)